MLNNLGFLISTILVIIFITVFCIGCNNQLPADEDQTTSTEANPTPTSTEASPTPAPEPNSTSVPETSQLLVPKKNLTGVYSMSKGYSGKVQITFDFIPNINEPSGVIGYAGSSTIIENYNSMNMLLQIGAKGFFQVRNGSSYTPLREVTYVKGVKYSIRMIVDVDSRLYDVYVTPENKSEIKIAEKFEFRTGSPEISDIGRLCLTDTLKFEIDGPQFTISNHTIKNLDSDEEADTVIIPLKVNEIDRETVDRNLPDVLLSSNNTKISTSEQWIEERRPEILSLFRENIYGKSPEITSEQISFSVEETDGMMDGKAIRKEVEITVTGPNGKAAIDLLLFLPKEAQKPVPVFILINNRSKNNTDPERLLKSDFWPAETMISRGYGAAAIHVSDAAPDDRHYYQDGVIGLFKTQENKDSSDAWGAVAAWAWSASRSMDYFETDKDIDASKVAVVGHSRGGKASLWCGAEDERFAMVVSNNSGSTGAALARKNAGETIRDINSKFPYWFNKNYKKYNGKEDELPVDQHMLISLAAPRLVYVASASKDMYSDPISEFLSCLHAQPVFSLFNLDGLGVEKMPPPGTYLHNGNIGYHIRDGKHDLTEYDWNLFMDYADNYMLNSEK